eukprot:6429759-Alexandrium_andersonii.AAC.1
MEARSLAATLSSCVSAARAPEACRGRAARFRPGLCRRAGWGCRLPYEGRSSSSRRHRATTA